MSALLVLLITQHALLRLPVCSVANLTWLDGSVLGGSILLTLLAGWYAGLGVQGGKKASPAKKTMNWTAYLLMGRKLTLPLFVATLVATWYGDILGVTQIAFQYGVYNFVTQGVFWYVSYLLFAFFMAQFVRKMQVRSFPELFSRLVGPGSGKVVAVMIFFKTLPIVYAMEMGIFLKTLFPISFPVAVACGLLFILLYSLFGGFRAIVFSDLLQAVLMYGGVMAVVVVSFFKFGGLDYLLTHCPPGHFYICSSFSVLDTLVWFFIALATTFLNPTFYQRCLAATTDRVAVWGICISTLCWLVFDLCTTLIGLYARAAMPHAPPLNAALQYALEVLPVGWRGLFVGAVLATILSTMDSFLFIASTTLMYDLKWMPSRSTAGVRFLVSLLTGSLTFCMAIYVEGQLELAWRMLKSIFSGCIFPFLVVGYCKPGLVTTKLFAAACISVLVAVLAWTVYKPWPLDAFYIGQVVGWGVLGFGLFQNWLQKGTE